MSRYIGMYVSHCDLCLCTKIQRRLPTGELQPLPILEERWDVISVDFISELLESGGYDSIMVAIDSAGKHSHFIEMVKRYNAAFLYCKTEVTVDSSLRLIIYIKLFEKFNNML